MKPTQKSIKEQLQEWSRLNEKLSKLQSAQAKEIAPIKAAFEESCAPIIEKHQSKILAVQEEKQRIESEIEKAVLSLTGEDGTPKMRLVESDDAKMEVAAHTVRECDSKVFFDFVSESERGSKFWECLKVQIGKAEKFLGDKLNTIAKVKQTFRVTITGK